MFLPARVVRPSNNAHLGTRRNQMDGRPEVAVEESLDDQTHVVSGLRHFSGHVGDSATVQCPRVKCPLQSGRARDTRLHRHKEGCERCGSRPAHLTETEPPPRLPAQRLAAPGSSFSGAGRTGTLVRDPSQGHL